MSRDVHVRERAKLMRQTLSDALDCSLGCIIRSVTPIATDLAHDMSRLDADTHGGFVIPCLDPVLMMTDWFS
jgi:hypothetical protein